jgi:hypothetical protein
MFYLLKNFMYLNLVILKIKCNNLIFNEISVLYASYVCLLHSCFIENHPIWILKDRPLIFEVVLSYGGWVAYMLDRTEALAPIPTGEEHQLFVKALSLSMYYRLSSTC